MRGRNSESMDRRHFLQCAAAWPAGSQSPAVANPALPGRSLARHATHPLPISMWDFSWLERRWPGAGYEDWDRALNELKVRGYEAVRIDCYPHLLAAGGEKTWELVPCWNQHDWGSPARIRVAILPALTEFMAKCARRGISVGLSTWFREDVTNRRMAIASPADLADSWLAVLKTVEKAGLLQQVLYVDLCNEFPSLEFAPFLRKTLTRDSAEGVRWMQEPIERLRSAFPSLDYTFSFSSEYDTWRKQDVSGLDFLELHLWMTHFSDFYERLNYHYEAFDPAGYDKIQVGAEKLYRSNPKHWQTRLEYGVDFLDQWSRAANKPLVTTECWGSVVYKDWPMLDWGWIKELCELGTRHAASKGRWLAIATSNFCGPQFRGMWNDVEWHQRLTEAIRNSAPAPARL